LPAFPIVCKDQITGLVLAGGRGSRMGGVDKGLQLHAGRPLVLHALERLAPQVGVLIVSANRNHASYQVFGAPVIPDELSDYPGPLAGMLAGLQHCATPLLATVPCDTPGFPLDLVARLAQALAEHDADLAMAATREADGSERTQPVFCLLKTSLRPSLDAYLEGGGRKIDLWAGRQRSVRVPFDDGSAFFNVNTAADLDVLRQG